jgi:hypothetical protein
VQVSVSAGGTIILTFAGEPDPGTKGPQALSAFNVLPDFVATLDTNIAAVTSHFAGAPTPPSAAPATPASAAPAQRRGN